MCFRICRYFWVNVDVITYHAYINLFAGILCYVQQKFDKQKRVDIEATLAAKTSASNRCVNGRNVRMCVLKAWLPLRGMCQLPAGVCVYLYQLCCLVQRSKWVDAYTESVDVPTLDVCVCVPWPRVPVSAHC